MQGRPIGIFDSGLGGLTTVKEILNLMPNENIVYFGDTARAPYGNKDRKTLLKYRGQATAFLVTHNVKFIVAACGTISSISDCIDIINGIPFQGVIQPTCEAAVKASKNGRIGVVGTTSTIDSKSYLHKILSINSQISVISQACPMFVPLIEKGEINSSDEMLLHYAQQYLSHFKHSGIDTLILGCTHYPIIAEIFKFVLGDSIILIDSGKETARFIYKELRQTSPKCEKNGTCKFFLSKNTPCFPKIANVFLDKIIDGSLEIIDINKY